MGAATVLEPGTDGTALITEYFAAWRGTDVDRIMAYFDDAVTVQLPGAVLRGKDAVRGHFVQPTITGFPGNQHLAQHMVFAPGEVVVEWRVVADHTGPYMGIAPTGNHLDLPGCSIYEYNPVSRLITAGRLYFDVGTLLKQIGAA